MKTILALICCGIFGLAGWWLYRNAARALDFVFGKNGTTPRLPVRFFSIFGLIMIGLAALSAAMAVLAALLGALGVNRQ
jgi:hypothetical protein